LNTENAEDDDLEQYPEACFHHLSIKHIHTRTRQSVTVHSRDIKQLTIYSSKQHAKTNDANQNAKL